ncbi:flagellar hook-length control protein FliK [Cellvibrio mixtus]|uniref:flagellar hook-length control protein FliK n=1 Tax=Cellvibrio mixtus TaxID=39650 RepID=UPI000587CA2B|nr:flagellar hook-length control protein FliK [Cellvibrio mixtus]
MDLGSINEKLLHNLQRTQIEQIARISKSLGLKIGSQFLAQAEKVTQATPTERAEIIKSIDATLAQLNKNSAAPATKALINQLTQQKQLLQDPTLKLVSLNANPTLLTGTTVTANTNAQNIALQNLLTYTNQPVQTGQTLLLQLTDNARLQILQPLSKTQVETLVQLLKTQGINLTLPEDPSDQPSNSPKLQPISRDLAVQIAKIDINKLLAEHTINNQPKAALTTTENVRTAISESLRNLLPKKDSGQDLLTNLPKVAQFIQQLPLAQRKEWLPNQIQDALKTLANHVRVSDQLSNPKMLAMALNNNGQSFENKLAQILQPPSTPTNTPTTISPMAKNAANIINNNGNPMNQLLGNGKSISTKLQNINVQQPTHQPKNIDKLAAQDLKGALLGLLHQLDTEITASSPGALLQNDSSKSALVNALPQFLGLLMNKQQGELNQKQLRTQLVMLMHQYTLGSLAKIQLQQIHTVNQQLNQADVAQPNQSWQFEIPVRHGQEIHPLQIHMEQQWIEEQQEDNSQKSVRVRQWSVMLNFDLPVVGKFYAQLGLLGNNLNAKFWAENENILAEAKQKIDSLTQLLEQEGIRVTHMQCIPGLPPKPKMLLAYSLVDVKT